MKKLIIEIGGTKMNPEITYVTDYSDGGWLDCFTRKNGTLFTLEQFNEFISFRYESCRNSFKWVNESELEQIERKLFDCNDWEGEREFMRAEAQYRELTEDEHIIYVI